MTEKLDALKDYPIYEKRPELIQTQTGKSVDEINIENILSGKVTPDDCRISAQTLEYQAQIEESAGNPQIAANFRRAAEMTRIPDERIIQIYNRMRPHVSTKEELLAIAEELETKYDAKINGALLRETVEVYEDRKMFRVD
ncbi:diol dehydratase small subunit [Sinanaerobacter chloroacetimidivorans]|uniref:Diol dehydratase small subunit n=1 Tax=Sinanaerobacter chloroacetimidivorans TaxID=2818044 RepID=A0A8J7W5Q8_9FIRM|nr:diol dehydratase small subunit [Sinanaerobacter chloroacetimidivorans]MBR0599583.1 diol dehydratase small subunit [Sinanaerobacter chloroacetimidivorans]